MNKKEYNKIYYQKHRQDLLNRAKQHYYDNIDNIKEQKKQYDMRNRENRNQKQRNRYATDPEYRDMKKIRATIRHALERNNNFQVIKDKDTETILGCSIQEFKDYIASKFQDGMSWDNWGEWHLDHIIPLSSATSVDDMYKLNHYTNFQPLWAVDNLKKGSQ